MSTEARICDGRVVIVTGAGRGIGREHALLFAAEGARVVVNDNGCERDGSGADPAVAQAVVAEIRAAGGEAVAHTGDASRVAEADDMVRLAVQTWGELHTVVANAGILRDRTIVNMEERDFDDVVATHLKGTWALTRAAARHWRARSKAGEPVSGRVICTSSPSGLFGNVGQTAYGGAKAGIAGFVLTAAQELGRYGVTVNAIAPIAMTRMTNDLPDFVKADEEFKARGFDHFHPGTISPTVVYLGSEHSGGITGRVFAVGGNAVRVLEGWVAGPVEYTDGRWAPGELVEVVPGLVRQAAPNADFQGLRN